MSDEERLVRLTEMARQVWPEVHSVYEHDGYLDAGALAMQGGYRLLMRIAPHPRALDALEAALLVLSGEGIVTTLPRFSAAVVEAAEKLAESRAKTSAELDAMLGKVPAWAEKLASEWDSSGDPAIRVCAAELRKRARGRQ